MSQEERKQVQGSVHSDMITIDYLYLELHIKTIRQQVPSFMYSKVHPYRFMNILIFSFIFRYLDCFHITQ